MKKILVLTLALWTGTANFAYLAARIECAAMMKDGQAMQKAEHSCCPASVPCQCAIKVPSNDQTVPSVAPEPIRLAPQDLPTLVAQTPVFYRINLEGSRFESPPLKPPLFTLFSVYRI